METLEFVVEQDGDSLSLEQAMDTVAAAAYIGVEPATMDGWRSKAARDPDSTVPKIPYYKLGRRVKYKKTDLDAFLVASRMLSPQLSLFPEAENKKEASP